jgi:hypothetical protein
MRYDDDRHGQPAADGARWRALDAPQRQRQSRPRAPWQRSGGRGEPRAPWGPGPAYRRGLITGALLVVLAVAVAIVLASLAGGVR